MSYDWADDARKSYDVAIKVMREKLEACEKVQIEGATLLCGDCLTILPTIAKADVVISDPPYEKEAHRPMRRTQASIKRGANADLRFSAIDEDTRTKVSQHAARISDTWALFFCQAEASGAWRDALEAAGAKYKRTMVWIKPDASPQFNGQMPAMGYESMPLAWCGKGRPAWNGGGRRGVFTYLTNAPDRHGVHPTEKPVSLMSELVSLFSHQGHSVLDPFMGSGTTGVACAKLGRKFIGIELDPKFFEIACMRIQRAYEQPDMFVERSPEPEQEAML